MCLLLQCDKLCQNVTTLTRTYSEKGLRVNRPTKALISSVGKGSPISKSEQLS